MGCSILKRIKRAILILQGESISFPMLRVVNMFNLGFCCLSRFPFKCSVIQQRYGSSSTSTCSLDLKLTGIRITTKSMLSTTKGEHRKLIGIKTMSLFGYGIQFLLSGILLFCFFVYCFSCHSLWTSMDLLAGVTQEEGHTRFFIHLLSAARPYLFLREGFSHPFPSSTVKSNFVY